VTVESSGPTEKMDTNCVGECVHGRVRTLTEAGTAYYESSVINCTKRLRDISQSIEDRLKQCKSGNTSDKNCVAQARNDILSDFHAYVVLSNEYLEYLKRTRTEDSELEAYSHKLVYESVQYKVHSAATEIEHTLRQMVDPVNKYTTPVTKETEPKTVLPGARK
jgi:hypothetical protein